ncbi:MAG: hypothetical protein WA254_16210 [Candidatus Sulfotelmatobacter sp.]
MDRTDPSRFVIPTLPEGKGRNLLFTVRAPNAYIQGGLKRVEQAF